MHQLSCVTIEVLQGRLQSMLPLLIAKCKLTTIGESHEAERLLFLLDCKFVCKSCFIEVPELLSRQRWAQSQDPTCSRTPAI